jgi:hypothetical protein
MMLLLRRTLSSAARCSVRGSLPGPARRITVEPIRIPTAPKIVPVERPAEEPERVPEREPVPAR